MARFRTDGLDDLIADMTAMGESTGELAEDICLGCAEEVKKAWKKSAQMHGLKDTGDMINSIGYPRQPKSINGIKTIDIYPQGKDRKGARNAEKAFILHYGTSGAKNRAARKGKKYKGPGIPASHWVDDADDMAAKPVEEKANQIYDAWLAKHGMK